MQLNLEEASSVELYAYKIILLKQINENNRLIKEIDNKLNKEKENAQTKSEKFAWTDVISFDIKSDTSDWLSAFFQMLKRSIAPSNW